VNGGVAGGANGQVGHPPARLTGHTEPPHLWPHTTGADALKGAAAARMVPAGPFANGWLAGDSAAAWPPSLQNRVGEAESRGGGCGFGV
jgi:hypothetical protein